jgi:cystathionine gamma-synthase
MQDVENYERKEPATLAKIKAGYPRFVRHEFIRAAVQQAGQALHREGEFFPLVSEGIGRQLLSWAGISDYQLDVIADWVLVTLAPGASAEVFAKLVQHTGALISSRQAEFYLKKTGEVKVGSLAQIQKTLQPYLATSLAEDIVITTSGMNAIFAAMQAVNEVQRPLGKKAWLQLGWLYVDTVRLMEKAWDAPHYFITDVRDLASVEKLLATGTIAGVITEVPTNPQLETADVAALRKLCDQHGALLVLDPSAVGLANVDVLPWADLVVSSLTKYAGSSGDIMAGVVTANSRKPAGAVLQKNLKAKASPLHPFDLTALATQIGNMGAITAKLSANAAEIARRLAKHPKVARVRVADQGPTAVAYKALQRPGAGVGSLLTIELSVPLQPVYDKLHMVKGPSFGLEFSLAAPFLWLAHFSEVTTPEGRSKLEKMGLDPDLIRLSVGAEPLEEIWQALERALS